MEQLDGIALSSYHEATVIISYSLNIVSNHKVPRGSQPYWSEFYTGWVHLFESVFKPSHWFAWSIKDCHSRCQTETLTKTTMKASEIIVHCENQGHFLPSQITSLGELCVCLLMSVTD